MASDFVRNIKDVRNIDILSPNITTENDLISTKDGEVYVVTNKGYRKITGVETKEIKQLKTDVSNVKTQADTNTLNISDLTDDIDTNTSEIETLKTTTHTNTSEIETLKTLTDNNTTNDTGWVPFDIINGAKGNSAFKSDSDNGFDCAYRIIKNGSVTEKSVRINTSKIQHLQNIAKLPEGFAKNVQFHYVRVPINQGYGLVGIFPSGSVYVYIESDKRDGWDSTSESYYFYGEFSWKE